MKPSQAIAYKYSIPKNLIEPIFLFPNNRAFSFKKFDIVCSPVDCEMMVTPDLNY